MYLEINVNANKFYYKVNVAHIQLVLGHQLHKHKDIIVQIIHVMVLLHKVYVHKFNHAIGTQQQVHQLVHHINNVLI
jgi:hypothetical protein